MFQYCQKYIVNGIMVCAPINLIENKLKSETSIEFVDFVDANFKFTEEVENFKEDKTQLFEAYREKYKVDSRNLTPIIFKKWLDRYMQKQENWKLFIQKVTEKFT